VANLLTYEENVSRVRHMRGHANTCVGSSLSCVPHVTHMSPYVATCEVKVGFYLLALRSHVEKHEIETTQEIQI